MATGGQGEELGSQAKWLVNWAVSVFRGLLRVEGRELKQDMWRLKKERARRKEGSSNTVGRTIAARSEELD